MNDGLRERIWNQLGELPPRDRPISAQSVAVEERSGYMLETLSLDLNGREPVAAYFAKPVGAQGPLPTVLYHHTHGGRYQLGKQELLDAHPNVLVDEPWVVSLTRAGFAVLCIDAWCFGTRSHTTEHDTVKLCLWQGRTLWGLMLYDALRAVDYLCSRPDVDAKRIGTAGMSMGSTMAWWLAAMDERIKVCAEECGLADYAALVEEKKLSEHNFYYFVPGLLRVCNSIDILSLIAPRPHLACVGVSDPKTPGTERVDAALRTAYAAAGAPDAWQLSRFDCGHREPPAMRETVLRFLTAHL